MATRGAEDSGEEEEGGEPEDKRAESLSMMPDTEENKPEDAGGGGGGGGTETRMSRSVSDSTLRRHALHLNLTSASSVLPSFTPLHQFKV